MKHAPSIAGLKRVMLMTGVLLATVVMQATLRAAASPAPQSQWVKDYDVLWDSPSVDSKGSMPLGNGDIGLNVWVVKDGDLWFYISKTDSWGNWTPGPKGLLKVGRVRVKFSPNPFVAGQPFSQRLDLARGQINILAGKPGSQIALVVWVDANRPVVHVAGQGQASFTMEAAFESTRPQKTSEVDQDTVFPGLKNEVAWCYQSRNSLKIPELQEHIFGALMRGQNLVSQGEKALTSKVAGKQFGLSLHALTRQPITQDNWLEAVRAQAAATDQVEEATARQEHEKWWREFWDRSWLRVEGPGAARGVTQGYILQRFKNACAGRGAWPIHFNGSIFTVDDVVARYSETTKKREEQPVNGDYRTWGARFWWQNTRAMYWPMLQSGDFDLMQPLFQFYRWVFEVNRQQVRERYGFDGVYFSEITPMQGGLEHAKTKQKLTAETEGSFVSHYFTSILEFSALALDYFQLTRDEAFARATLIPVADNALKFFAHYFPRDEKGRLLLDPDNALETYWKARNPTPDIAGLRWVSAGLLALPEHLSTPEQRKGWQELSAILPAIPLGEREGRPVILPVEKYNEAMVNPKRIGVPAKAAYLYMRNMENPELYAVYPFRHYGVGKPDLERAIATYQARLAPFVGCWHQDSIDAARLGLATEAQDAVSRIFDPAHKSPRYRFTEREQVPGEDNGFRFPGFWGPGHDYTPDEDHGGNGMNALQAMLMQCEGKRIILLPAWPDEWNCRFKLHAPFRTTVEGRVLAGKVVDLKVTPTLRTKDVETFMDKSAGD